MIEKEIITESAIVAQFLADSRPSHLLPASLADPKAPLFRARVAFFTDTWNTKVQANLFTLLKAEGEEQEKITQDIAKAIEKEIEPLLKDAAPFFGGKSEMTMAEVSSLRTWHYIRTLTRGVIGHCCPLPAQILRHVKGRTNAQVLPRVCAKAIQLQQMGRRDPPEGKCDICVQRERNRLQDGDQSGQDEAGSCSKVSATLS